MITGRPQKNLQAALQYFAEHLAHGDYYSETQAVPGFWFGKGGDRLGLLSGSKVTQLQFARLCKNLHPTTGLPLTVRNRKADRRVFTDFCVSPPKSVSLMALLAGDDRIVAAHDRAATEALIELEKSAAAYVRKGGQHSIRITGEVVAAAFRHDCSRALDPQLHTHFVVFNATWDSAESRWKALESAPIFDRIGFFTEIYRNALATDLLRLGYRLRETAHGFEIDGVPQSLIDRFSKRNREIVEAERKLVERLKKPLSNNARASLAHSRRQRKIKNLSGADKFAFQREQLSDGEFEQLRSLIPPRHAAAVHVPHVAAQVAIAYAMEHLFERKTVVPKYEVFREALKHRSGLVSFRELENTLNEQPGLIAIGDDLTTKAALRQEQRMVSLVNQGLHIFPPLNSQFVGNPHLSTEQQGALRGVLDSTDRVVAVRGAAGTGKTTLMKEVIRGISERHKVFVVAPSAAAVDNLRQQGINKAMTLAQLLHDPNYRETVKDAVLLIDEAGLMSTRQVLDLLELPKSCRLVPFGDSSQHHSVEAGDALRILERHSALKTVRLRTIQRQVHQEYRQAVQEISRGNVDSAYMRLEKAGAIENLAETERHARLASEYRNSITSNKSALIVCPTWQEIEAATKAVRQELRTKGLLSLREKNVVVHDPLMWTQAQKKDLEQYKVGYVLSFHKKTKSFKAGESATVQSVHPDHLVLQSKTGKRVSITGKQARCYSVAQKREIPIAAGERLLIRANRKMEGLFNGQIVTVKSIGLSGTIQLTDGRKLKKDFKAFTHGYAITSPGSQARTADHVFIAVNTKAVKAISRKQFYVSVSRGREKVKIFTDDKDILRSAVQRPGTRLSAMELIARGRRHKAVALRRIKKQSMKLGLGI